MSFGWARNETSARHSNLHLVGRTKLIDLVYRDAYYSNMNADLLNRITSNPRQCGGRPCIRSMRIRVKDVLDMLAGGATEAEILQDYPYLEAEDIRACLEYASAQVDHAVVMVGP